MKKRTPLPARLRMLAQRVRRQWRAPGVGREHESARVFEELAIIAERRTA